MLRILSTLFIVCFFSPKGQSQSYKNLVFEGGGIRGIAYAGALTVLEKEGALQSVEKVAGTSVGAIVAMMVALGYSSDEMQSLLAELNLRTFNDGHWFFIGGQYRFRRQFGWYRGDRLEKWLGDCIKAKTGNANSSLKELQILSENNNAFKSLFVTATDLRHQKTVVLSADNHPDLPIKTAVRASISIPLYFEAVLLDSSDQRYDDIRSCTDCGVFVDGGLLQNYPLNIFDSTTEDGHSIPNCSTLGLKLERPEQIEGYQNSSSIAPYPITGMNDYVGALYNIGIEGLNRKLSYDQEAFRTIYISTGNIRPRVRKLPKHTVDALLQNGRDGANRFFSSLKDTH